MAFLCGKQIGSNKVTRYSINVAADVTANVVAGVPDP
jgi:hypothetical protein